MKQTCSGAMLLLVILPALLQDRQPASVCSLETRYDPGADTTTVKCALVELGDSSAKLTVQANASFRGKGQDRVNGPDGMAKFWLFLSSNRGKATRHTQPLFREATALYLLMDSTPLEIPVKDYHNVYFELVPSFAESARADISHEDLRKLLDAKSVKGRWGDVEFKFSDAALASLKDFISRQVFAESTR
jgi:hypothetical protein